ncbi:MAG: prepilin peptidase [Eubacteriales bacterium]|nr:prepilin peptidase [Eubacteriales bacterium]
MPEWFYMLLGYIVVFLFGIIIGSFLNVCIFREPKQESLLANSHCMHCGYELRWYDLVPLFSYLILRGRCRKCHTKISLQYPLVEGLNGALYVIVFLANGWNLTSIVYCLLTSALIVLSVIDWRTTRIPDKVNVVILLLGIFATLLDLSNWRDHLIGMVCVSAVLWIIFLVSVGRAMGGGDAKLMTGAGLALGALPILFAFIIGCVVGSVIHVGRMLISHADKKLAFGPYLAFGIWFSMLFGAPIIEWYLRMCGLM